LYIRTGFSTTAKENNSSPADAAVLLLLDWQNASSLMPSVADPRILEDSQTLYKSNDWHTSTILKHAD